MNKKPYIDTAKISAPIIATSVMVTVMYTYFLKPAIAKDFVGKETYKNEINLIKTEYKEHIKDIKEDLKIVSASNQKIYEILLQMKGARL